MLTKKSDGRLNPSGIGLPSTREASGNFCKVIALPLITLRVKTFLAARGLAQTGPAFFDLDQEEKLERIFTYTLGGPITSWSD